ncbi:MAG: IclR family transcriptional regulator [Thermoleophilia bacterium]|nr:IclR family transcriptional regulator [Thermoleophilia bacterium]
MTPSPRKPEQTAPYQVKALDKAIDILDAFTLRRRELSIREIVQATKLNRSTAIRLVANLERRGLLQQAPEKGRYRLGRRLLEMAAIVSSSFALRQAAEAPLAELAQRSGATIILAAWSGDYSLILDKRQGVGDGFAMVPLPGEVGTARPLTYGPIGHVVLATFTPEAVEDFLDRYPLERYTPYSMTDREQLLERLPLIRERGYAIEVNEVVEGLMGIAAPILDSGGEVVGAVAMGFPSTRERDQDFVETAVRDLKQTAAEVSANMGYAGEGSTESGGAETTETDESD